MGYPEVGHSQLPPVDRIPRVSKSLFGKAKMTGSNLWQNLSVLIIHEENRASSLKYALTSFTGRFCAEKPQVPHGSVHITEVMSWWHMYF